MTKHATIPAIVFLEVASECVLGLYQALSGTHALSGPSLRVNLLPNGQGFVSWESVAVTGKSFHVHSLKDFQPVAPLRWPGETKPIPDPGPVPTPTPWSGILAGVQ